MSKLSPLAASTDVLHNPIDIYRCQLAETIVSLVHSDPQIAFDAIQSSNEVGNGDLVITLPRLRLQDASNDFQGIGTELTQQVSMSKHYIATTLGHLLILPLPLTLLFPLQTTIAADMVGSGLPVPSLRPACPGWQPHPCLPISEDTPVASLAVHRRPRSLVRGHPRPRAARPIRTRLWATKAPHRVFLAQHCQKVHRSAPSQHHPRGPSRGASRAYGMGGHKSKLPRRLGQAHRSAGRRLGAFRV